MKNRFLKRLKSGVRPPDGYLANRKHEASSCAGSTGLVKLFSVERLCKETGSIHGVLLKEMAFIKIKSKKTKKL